MYIKRIELENIRCFSDKEEIFLSPGLNYFVGENNSGKSSVMHALDYIRSFSSKDESKIYTNNSDLSKVVIDIAEDNWDEILQEGSLAKLATYLFDDPNGEGQILRVRRQSKEESVTQNGKKVNIDSKKVAFWNQKNKRYENATGIDAIFKKLLDLNFIYADEAPGDHSDMSSTKTLGKLISGCISDVSSRELWDNFTVAHRNLFIENGNGGVQDALFGLGKELSALLANQYAPGIQAKFMFEMPDTSSFLKSGYVSISNGNNGEDETDLANKGTGLQRAFMLALLQLYARKSTGGFDKPHRITFGLDEPETWLHPRAQIKLIEAVRKISERQQVLLVTHSPYMLQNFNPDDSAVIIFGDNQNGGRTFTYTELNKCKLPYISWNAINYYVFGVPSVEFMDELYGHFQNKVSENKGSMFERDIIKELNNQGVKSTEKWKKEKMSKDRKTKILEESIVPLCVYVRNSVHHPENRNNDKYTVDQLLGAIKELESVLEES